MERLRKLIRHFRLQPRGGAGLCCFLIGLWQISVGSVYNFFEPNNQFTGRGFSLTVLLLLLVKVWVCKVLGSFRP